MLIMCIKDSVNIDQLALALDANGSWALISLKLLYFFNGKSVLIWVNNVFPVY